MPLIVAIEDFLKESRYRVVKPCDSDTVVMIYKLRQATDQDAVAELVDDDDLITWEDAAW